MKAIVDFGSATETPTRCIALFREVDFETSQNLDLDLPANSLWKIDSVETIIRTAPSAITTRPRLGISKIVAGTASVIRGTQALLAQDASAADIITGVTPTEGEYMYLQNIAAATNSGLITQVATLNTAGSATVTAATIAVPRKLRVVVVDNAGSNLAGTVTLTGTAPNGEVISEIVTVVGATLTYDTVQAFASLTAVAHNFGATGQVTVDTLDVGMDTSLSLGEPYSEVTKLVSAGTVEAVGAADRVAGTFDPTTAPNGTNDYEVWYRNGGATPVITGGNTARLVVVAGTVTGDDVRDILVRLTRW